MAKAGTGQIDYAQLKGHKLGRILRKLGTVKKEQVHEALEIQKAGRKVPIGQLLVELGHITQRDVNEGLAAQAGMAYVDLEGVELPQNAIDAIPSANVRVFGVVPLEYNERAKRLKIAMKNANNFRAVDDIRLLLGVTVEAVVGDADIIDKLIDQHFAKSESMTDVVSDLASDDKFTSLTGDQSIDLEAVLEAAEDNKIVKLLNLVLMQAIGHPLRAV